MEASLRSRDGRLVVKLQADGIKELFEAIGSAQDVIDADVVCGACQSPAIRYRVRTVLKFKYYEWWCGECHAVLQFGQLREGGGLFAKRYAAEGGGPLPNGGWARYTDKLAEGEER